MIGSVRMTRNIQRGESASVGMNSIWQTLREAMPVTRRWAYFDHAAVSPLPSPTRQAVIEWADHFAEAGVVDWGSWRERIEVVRQLAADRIKASPAEIALIRNTTEGITLIAEGFPWRPGDNVVVPDSEFPSNYYPWLNLAERGVEFRKVRCPDGVVDPGEVASHIDHRTRVVAVSWVGYATGYRADLAALAERAHAHGALLFVDAIQGLGMLRLDVNQIPVDFLAADGHKWMLGPEGAGVLYVRDCHLDRLRPFGVGWQSVVQAGNFADKELRLKEDASRFEGGTHNMVGFVGLSASLGLTAGLETDVVEQRLQEVTAMCCERLRTMGAEIASRRAGDEWSGIIAFDLPGYHPEERKRHCLRQGVVLNARDGRLRISPHLYTSLDDIDRLAAALASPAVPQPASRRV